MSNLLFFVELDPEVVSIGKEARQALLRIQCQTDLDQLLTESVVFTLLSGKLRMISDRFALLVVN